jgi:hypothetical protein
MNKRRAFVVALLLGLLTFAPTGAHASMARALRLSELVHYSHAIVIGTPRSGFSRWETIGGSRRIVTYTRVHVDQGIDGSTGSELLIRTLGGQVGHIGQLVEGEAMLIVGQPALIFVYRDVDGTLSVTGMAQGHYPLIADAHGTLRLHASPRLAQLVNKQGSAVQALVGLDVNAAERRIAATPR